MCYKNPDEFFSLAELKKYTINCIQTIGLCESLLVKDPELYTYFENLFHRHPDKYKKGVDKMVDISICKFPGCSTIYSWSDYQIFINKNDGTKDSISWSKCINKCDNPVEKKLKYAMRISVMSQIRTFKSGILNKKCEFCETTSELTVDHVIKFKKLTDDFISENMDYPKNFGKNKFAQEIFLESDKEYENRWMEYHLKNAKLRILCKKCNSDLEPGYKFEDK